MGELKNKTEAELENELKGLIEVRDILDDMNLTWFLSGGALLGAVRNNDFIKWDWDVGIALLIEEISDPYSIINSFEKNGFKLDKFIDQKGNMKFLFIKYHVTFELLCWYKGIYYRKRKAFKRPSKFYSNQFDIVKIRQHSFRAPKNVEAFLNFVYGKDWKQPKRTNHKSAYFNNKNFRFNWKKNLKKFLWIFKIEKS